MTPEEQAHALTRWLAEPPGTEPPSALDPDVVESVYALRPDLAPAARVTPDEILASLASGPLASGEGVSAPIATGEPAEVVAFPTGGGEAPATSPKRRWWRAANQWGGISAIVATAATLMVVSLPLFQLSTNSYLEADPAAPDVAAGAQAEKRVLDTGVRKVPLSRPATGPVDKMSAKPRPAKPKILEAQELDAVADVGELEEAVDIFDMDEQEAPKERAVIAEVAAQRRDAGPPEEHREEELAASGYMEDDFDNTAGRAASNTAEPPAVDLSALRVAGDPGGIGTAWRSDVDGATLSAIDDAIARSDEATRAGRVRDAADILAAHITAPPSMGQAQAVAAATLYLRVGDTAAAISVISRGLSLSTQNTASRAKLEVLFGDALQRQGQQSAAEAAYRRAIQINQSR